jgi:hypothetical protein
LKSIVFYTLFSVEDGEYLLGQWITNLDPRRPSLSTVTSSSGKELLLGSCDRISLDQDSTGVEEPNNGAATTPDFHSSRSADKHETLWSLSASRLSKAILSFGELSNGKKTVTQATS